MASIVTDLEIRKFVNSYHWAYITTGEPTQLSSAERVAAYNCFSAPSLGVNGDQGNGTIWRTEDRDGDGGRIGTERADVMGVAGRRAEDEGGEGAGQGRGI